MKVAVIGCGTMGTALARHLAKEHTLHLCDHSLQKAENLAKEFKGRAFADPQEAVKGVDIVLVAVKPHDIDAVSLSIGAILKPEQLLISVLAGVTSGILRSYFPHVELLRIMPNLALTCGEGVIGIVDDGDLSEETKKRVDAIFKGLGLVVYQPESKIEALAALAGSGPAFVLVVIEAMIEAGIMMGFKPKLAQELALQTVKGAVALLEASKKHPAELRWQIASPGGTTIYGLKEMESSGVHSGMIDAILATHRRSEQLHKRDGQD